MLTEADANGRDSTRTLVLNGKVAFHEIHTYNDDANLVRYYTSRECNKVSKFAQPLVQSEYKINIKF